MFQPNGPSGSFSGAIMIPADMLMDCAVIWATARIANMNQALWIPLGARTGVDAGISVAAMVLIYLKGNRPVSSVGPVSLGPLVVGFLIDYFDLVQRTGR